MADITEQFLTRIESLGDNCEIGFVMRNLKYEKGSLFRWSITPIAKLIDFIEEPDQTLFDADALEPFSPGMVVDKQTGFSFHSKMRSEKNDDGKLVYIAEQDERAEIHDKEKSKIEYLRNGFKQRLNSDAGSIYLVKANNGMDEAEVGRLATAIGSYSEKHVLVEVRAQENADGEVLIRKSDNHFQASISRFAPYVAANDVLYDEWNTVLGTIQIHPEINEKLG